MKRFLIIVLASLFLYTGGCASGPSTESETEKKDEKAKEKPFAEVVKDYKKIPGLFTLYHNEEDGKVFLEIKPDQLDKIYLCSITREAGEGYYFDSAAMSQAFPFIFKKVNKRIQFIHKNVYYTADKESPFYSAVSRGVSDSLMGSAKIESQPHPETKGILIDLANLFIQDFNFVSYRLSEHVKRDYSFDKNNSYFSSLKSFPKNTEISVVLNFKSSKPKDPAPTLPDPRSMLLGYHYSLSTLPETGYKPRLADDRVGHFITMYQDYTSLLKDTPYVRYINRWHLEKANPNAKLSPPKQPIVFWLEKTIPHELRDAVRRGVLLWNQAFERIGFKDAIIVKQQPDDADWNPADVRYNTICWILRPGAGYAVGPSRTNPFTGQIYDADIRVSADIVRWTFRKLEEFVNPVSINTPEYYQPGTDYKGCHYAEGAAIQAAFGRSLLAVRGLLDPDDPEVKKFVQDYITDLIVHEVGHTLGLRHNFKASSIHTLNQLHDKTITGEEGISGSVMDYNPANIAPSGTKQGAYWQTMLGPYDYWVIEYAYKPIDAATPEDEKKELDKIVAKLGDPKLVYGTDHDSFGFHPKGVDPLCNPWDLGNDPIEYFKGQIALSKELWSKMEEKFNQPGVRYQKLRRVFAMGFNPYSIGGLCVSKYVGGLYFRRDHIGDPGNRLPFEPVSAEKQRQAINFLHQYIFAADAFSFSPELLNKLAPERFPQFEESKQNITYPVHQAVLDIQKAPLNRLYDPLVLSRILDTELRYPAGKEPFTLTEMFERLRKGIWSELNGGKNINSFRRPLQKAHLAKLINLLVKPAEGTPEDAISLARRDLVALRDSIKAILPNHTVNTYTRAHLEECLARIEAALQAKFQR